MDRTPGGITTPRLSNEPYLDFSRLERVGTLRKATEKEAEKTMQAALAVFKTWRHMPAIERAGIVLRASRMMKQRRFEFDAAMILDEGKNWLEADADFAGAIDFLDFHAREAIRYAQPDGVTPYPGECQELRYIPLGVGVVIPPWNFPCAIVAGTAFWGHASRYHKRLPTSTLAPMSSPDSFREEDTKRCHRLGGLQTAHFKRLFCTTIWNAITCRIAATAALLAREPHILGLEMEGRAIPGHCETLGR